MARYPSPNLGDRDKGAAIIAPDMVPDTAPDCTSGGLKFNIHLQLLYYSTIRILFQERPFNWFSLLIIHCVHDTLHLANPHSPAVLIPAQDWHLRRHPTFLHLFEQSGDLPAARQLLTILEI